MYPVEYRGGERGGGGVGGGGGLGGGEGGRGVAHVMDGERGVREDVPLLSVYTRQNLLL